MSWHGIANNRNRVDTENGATNGDMYDDGNMYPSEEEGDDYDFPSLSSVLDHPLVRFRGRYAPEAVLFWRPPVRLPPSLELKNQFQVPSFAPTYFNSLVRDRQLHPPPSFLTVGNSIRRAIPPLLALPEENTGGWYVIRHRHLIAYPHGNVGAQILQQFSHDDAETLRQYTRYAQNLLVYKTRLQILYRLIGELSFISRWSDRDVCVIFIALPFFNMAILNELVAAHGSQLYSCTNEDRSESWVLFNGTEELADNGRIYEAVVRAAALTWHGL